MIYDILPPDGGLIDPCSLVVFKMLLNHLSSECVIRQVSSVADVAMQTFEPIWTFSAITLHSANGVPSLTGQL